MRILAIVCLILLSGCGVRQIDYTDGSSQSEFFFGLGKTVNCTAEPGVSVESTTLGAWEHQRGIGLGFHSGRYVCGSTDCQVVIWPASGIDAAALRKELGDLENICVVE